MTPKVCAYSLSLVLATALAAQQDPAAPATPAAPTAEKPRVFITDSESWEVNGSAGGNGHSWGAQSHGGARPQTAEIIKTFGQRCPAVLVNNRQELADFVVVLDHEGGKGYLRHRNKVAVFEYASGDVVVSHSTLSLGGSVEEACNGIVQYWTTHSSEILAAKQKTKAPQPLPVVATAAAAPVPTPAVPAAILVDSTPGGADIEIDGAFVGNTPSTLNVAAGSHDIAVKKKGFNDWTKKLNVTGGSVHLNAELEAEPAKP